MRCCTPRRPWPKGFLSVHDESPWFGYGVILIESDERNRTLTLRLVEITHDMIQYQVALLFVLTRAYDWPLHRTSSGFQEEGCLT